MIFDEIINPGVPSGISKKLKEDFVFIYSYSILRTHKNNLDLLLSLDDVLLGNPLEQSSMIQKVKEEIIRQADLVSQEDVEKEEKKEQVYL